jgi:uncharacterized Fe-S cluster-containing radical SAM superfamily protein
MTIYDNGKVLLAGFEHAEGMQADNAGKTTSELGAFWRTKTYVKPNDMVPSLLASWPLFPQPYQMAQALYGGTWNDYNKAFIIQVAKCNLRCFYCYCDQDLLEGKTHNEAGAEVARWFDVDEILDMWRGESGLPIFRISGGEPTLVPEFLIQMIAAFEDMHDTLAETGFLWIDTNLSTGRSFIERYKKSATALEYHPNVGVSGCFKGFTDEDATKATGAYGLLDIQFKMAKALIEETDLETFFYVPGIISCDTPTPRKAIEEFFDRLREEVDERAPLRTYLLQIKDYSKTPKAETEQWKCCVPDGKPLPVVWQQLCNKHYAPELLWLPNHQVQFKKREE